MCPPPWVDPLSVLEDLKQVTRRMKDVRVVTGLIVGLSEEPGGLASVLTLTRGLCGRTTAGPSYAVTGLVVE